MAARPPRNGSGERLILVRLTDVPADLRVKTAWKVIAREGLAGIDALELVLAATAPRENPARLVPATVARRILGHA